ncbi:effector-associated domain 2-containing protein [Haliangium sp.]|uniref:effector-associated domain 2-containing protein n=1 Tax=Haliangium sp. TaxID=2663208 RepID=UPI003D0AD6D3
MPRDDQDGQDALVVIIEKCSAVRERHKRDALVRRLPEALQLRIPPFSDLRTYVSELVRVCNEYEGGLAELRNALHWHEQGTRAMDEVDAFLAARGIALSPVSRAAWTPVAPAAASRPAAEPAREHGLTAFVDRASAGWRVRCQLASGRGAREHTVSAALASRLEAAAATLTGDDDAAVKALLAEAPRALGNDLFELLLGDEAEWRPLLREVFATAPGEPDPMPIWAPVQVRIVTNDELIAVLPWRLITWRRHLLLNRGWRLAVTPALSDRRVATAAPTTVLVIAPRAATLATTGRTSEDDVHLPEHARAVQDLLAGLWPAGAAAQHVAVAGTRREVVHRMGSMTPTLVYVYSAVEERGGAPCLLLDPPDDGAGPDDDHAPDALPLSEFAHLLGQTDPKPSVVYLHTGARSSRTTGTNPFIDADIPLVLWRPRPRRSEASSQLALSWLKRWLGDGDDPVEALHEAGRRAGLTTDPEAASVVASTSYLTWSTQQADVVSRTSPPLACLDRDEAKALVVRHVLELAQSRTRRVTAVVAYAKPGNHIADLWSQLRRELRVRGEAQVAVNWRQLELPLSFRQPYKGQDRRERLRADLERALRHGLEADDNEPLRMLLSRHAPRNPGRARRVLWLTWGVCGEGHEQPPLKGYHLEAWTNFAAEVLARSCADNLRVISYLAMETPHPDKVSKKLADLLDELSAEAAFALDDIELGSVAKKHLLNYLRDHTDCAATLHKELAERIMAETRGAFDATVAYLTQASEGSTWRDLRDRLRYSQGDSPTDDEDDDL